MRVMISSGTGSGLRRRKARAEYIASNSLISGIASPHAANSFGSLPARLYSQQSVIIRVARKVGQQSMLPDRLLALADEVIE
jgi:hypothetical protein